MKLKELIKWQAADVRGRSVTVEIKSEYGEQVVRIWCWDNNLHEGQYVNSIGEIDIPAVVKKRELEKLAELQKKYA